MDHEQHKTKFDDAFGELRRFVQQQDKEVSLVLSKKINKYNVFFIERTTKTFRSYWLRSS
jgi:uncharacterized FlaG/YvyC family protein